MLSSENLSGRSRLGACNARMIADRLADVFPAARILLVLREQKSMLLAQYHQYLRRGGVWSLQNFLNPPIKDAHKIPYFDWDRFQYHQLISYYMRRFGPEKVLVLPLELLNQNPVCFVTRILQFCRLTAAETAINNLPFRRRVRPSHSSLTLNLQRPFNFMFGEQTSFNPRSLFPLNRSKKLFDRWSRRIDRLLPDLVTSRYQRRAEAIVAAAVRDYFADSNRITSELTGLRLAEYGYDSPEISADMAC